MLYHICGINLLSAKTFFFVHEFIELMKRVLLAVFKPLVGDSCRVVEFCKRVSGLKLRIIAASVISGPAFGSCVKWEKELHSVCGVLDLALV